MNTELLFSLYGIHSPSGSEKKMRKYLKKQAAKRGATKIEQDASGNLFITKGESDTYPCVAAHMDQVQKNHSKDFKCVIVGGDVIGWSSKSHSQQGLGADDKNGIFICLECLETFDVLKVAFFVGEEVGCVGSSACDLSFFSDCRFIIQPDRMNGNDLITSMCCGDVCSKKFTDELLKMNKVYGFGYKEAEGTITDVGTLVERGVGISCLNLSCGYYRAHSDYESTVLHELDNCLKYVKCIVTSLTDVYPFEYKGYSDKWDYDDWSGYCYGGYDKKKWASRVTKWESEESEYWDGGYYDEDFDTMMGFLETEPNLPLADIHDIYCDDFYATSFFTSVVQSHNMLDEIYGDAKALIDYNSDYERHMLDDDESEDANDVVFPVKKVS